MEIIKNIAAVVGCISACIGLIVVVFKPIRQSIVAGITNKQRESEAAKKLNQVINDIKDVKLDTTQSKNVFKVHIDQLKADVSNLNDKIEDVKDHVLDNEKDRLKSELFTCGNRCRRGVSLFPEEMAHIRDVYNKYHTVLNQNHDGTLEYEFILDYYNSQKFDSAN